jgi:uncharacterized protein (DUF2267 family)
VPLWLLTISPLILVDVVDGGASGPGRTKWWRAAKSMNDNHLPVLEHTIQKTNIWLKKLEEDLGNRHQAYSALRSVLHALRDRLPRSRRCILQRNFRSLCGASITRAGTLVRSLVRGAIWTSFWRASLPICRPSSLRRVVERTRSRRDSESYRLAPTPLRALWPEAARG